jgi:sodium transport system permease protein
MAIAIRCKTFKEAQANATVVVLAVSMLPLVSDGSTRKARRPGTCGCRPGADDADGPRAAWRGPAVADVLLPVLVSVAAGALAMAFVARTLRSAALK